MTAEPPILVGEPDGLLVRLDPAAGYELADRRGAVLDRWAPPPRRPGEEPPAWQPLGPAGLVGVGWPDGARAVVNRGPEAAQWGGLTLPPGGFCLAAASFRAFYLLAGFGQRFRAPTLAAVASLDGLPIAESTQVRVRRWLGDDVVLVDNVHGQMQYRDEVITREPAGFYVPLRATGRRGEADEEVVAFHDWYG